MPQSRRNEQLINTTDRRERKDQPNKIKLNSVKQHSIKVYEAKANTTPKRNK